MPLIGAAGLEAGTQKLYFPVNRLDEVLTYFDQLKIYRSTTGRDGVYAEISADATRIRLQPGVALYNFWDPTGTASAWYRCTFFNSKSLRESSPSDPVLGDDPQVISGILTVQEMKDIYLCGIDLTDDKGVPYPDIMYDFSIRAAISWMERELALPIRPTDVIEYQDYDHTAFQAWGHVQLDKYPVISVTSVELTWPSLQTPFAFPTEWIRCELQHGRINLVPTSGSLAQALALAGYMPIFTYSMPFVPRGLRITYRAGWEYGTTPYEIRQCIGWRAAIPILDTAGDLIAGAGIASFSIGVDGLSQSVSTTSSAENAGYSARIKSFLTQMKSALPAIKRYYRNVGLVVA